MDSIKFRSCFYETQNPGKTKYIVTISENGGDHFITLVDTLLVISGLNGFGYYVSTIPEIQTQDIVGIVRHAYSKNPESGVVVRVINRDNGELIEEDITSSDGAYAFNDIPDEVTDTLVTFNRYF